jgi:purine-binding chemotaxis protein CheW
VPGFVAGIIAVRGQVMPVIDLRQRLRMRTAGLSPKSRILIVSRPAAGHEVLSEEERERFGLVVDRVNEVVRIHEIDIEPPTVLSGKESEFVEGIGRVRNEVEESARRDSGALWSRHDHHRAAAHHHLARLGEGAVV